MVLFPSASPVNFTLVLLHHPPDIEILWFVPLTSTRHKPAPNPEVASVIEIFNVKSTVFLLNVPFA